MSSNRTTIVALVITAATASAQAGPWSDAEIAAGLTGVRGVALADIDGDGDQDVLTASRVADEIAWHENVGGDGSTWVAQVVSAVANGAQSVSGVDLDGDGDMDVLAASALGDAVEWFENVAGDGSTWTAHLIATVDGAHMACAGDLDWDGDLDVVSTSATPGSGSRDRVTWHEQVWSSWSDQTIDDTLDSIYHMSLADADIDGDLDIAAAATVSDTAVYYENVDYGDSWNRVVLSAAALDGARSAEMADLDRDGDLDIAVTARFADTVVWYENDAGSWVEHAVASADGAHHVVPHDIDRDGDLDLALAAEAADTVAWIENLGSAAAWSVHELTTSADGARSVAVGDVDGDGDPDLVAGSELDDTAAWFENQTPSRHPLFCPGATIPFVDPAELVPVDAENDGDTDIVSASGSSAHVLLNHGSSWSVESLGQDTPFPILDLELTTSGLPPDGNHAIYVADGTNFIYGYGTVPSTFSPPVIFTMAGGVLLMNAPDYTSNAIQDTVSTVCCASFPSGFTLAVWTTIDGFGGTYFPVQGAHLAIADVTGDGTLDVIVDRVYEPGGALLGDDLSVYEPGYDLAGASGLLLVAPIEVTPTRQSLDVQSADVDQDGDLDLVWLGYDNVDPNAATVAWFENTAGDGSAWQRHTIASIAADEMIVADFDQDGDPDVAAAEDTLFWCENAGGGTAWAVHELAAGLSPLGDFVELAAADYDSDGDDDLLVGSWELDELRWFENKSELSVETVRAGTPPNPSVLLPGVSNPPAVGTIWDPVIDHTSFMPTALLDLVALTLAPTNIPLPPYGTLLCLPPVLGDLLTSAPGVPFVIPIPNNCAFVGLSLCAQGIGADALGGILLTNALDITLGTY